MFLCMCVCAGVFWTSRSVSITQCPEHSASTQSNRGRKGGGAGLGVGIKLVQLAEIEKQKASLFKGKKNQ